MRCEDYIDILREIRSGNPCFKWTDHRLRRARNPWLSGWLTLRSWPASRPSHRTTSVPDLPLPLPANADSPPARQHDGGRPATRHRKRNLHVAMVRRSWSGRHFGCRRGWRRGWRRLLHAGPQPPRRRRGWRRGWRRSHHRANRTTALRCLRRAWWRWWRRRWDHP